jgi:hypothetical protein
MGDRCSQILCGNSAAVAGPVFQDESVVSLATDLDGVWKPSFRRARCHAVLFIVLTGFPRSITQWQKRRLRCALECNMMYVI